MLRTLTLLSLLALLHDATAALVPEDPTTFFLTPDAATELRWKTGERLPDLGYRILSYDDREVHRGLATADGSSLSVTVKLPRGYYEVEIGGERFGVIAHESFQGEADLFFGMDAVLTWLEKRPEMRAAMVRDLKRSGVAMARERLNWNKLEPSAGQFDWENEKDQTVRLRQFYQQEKLPVLEMFHSAGPAGGEFPLKTVYPQNLALMAQSWPQIYRKLESTWGGLEVWNEPEGKVYGSGLPSDQYVTLVKTMRYAFQSNGITPPLGGGVFMGGHPALFQQFCAWNGLLDHVDFISFHDYKRATQMEQLVARYRDWVSSHGKTGMPLWITETGWSWPKGGGRPKLKDDVESAMEIAMKGVEAKACGVARYMPFCLAFYEEYGAKSFSMIGKEITPLRSMAAYVQSIRILSGKQYAGDLPIGQGSVLRARVFENGKGEERVAVIYSGTAGEVKVKAPAGLLRAEDIDGRELTPDAEGLIRVNHGMAYLWPKGGELQRNPETDRLLAASRTPAPAKNQAEPVVLQFIPGNVTASSTRYLMSEEDAGKAAIRVRVHNLSEQPQSVRLKIALPSGELTSEETELELPPARPGEVEWTLDLRSLAKFPKVQAVTVIGKLAGGKSISPLAIPLFVEGSLDSFLPLYPRRDKVEILDTSRWSHTISSAGSMNMEESDQVWRLSLKFTQGDRWAYPRYWFSPGRLSGASGFLLRARVEKPADVRMGVVGKRGEIYLTFDPLIPADGKWHVVYVPLENFEPNQEAQASGRFQPGELQAISIGMNDRSLESANVLEVSDLFVVAEK